jgi:hypothetical protein
MSRRNGRAGVDEDSSAAAFGDAVPAHGGQHRCPHRPVPLAVISVLAPAAVAAVNTPEVTHA